MTIIFPREERESERERERKREQKQIDECLQGWKVAMCEIHENEGISFSGENRMLIFFHLVYYSMQSRVGLVFCLVIFFVCIK